MNIVTPISRLSLVVVAVLAGFAIDVLAADAGDRKFIRDGMTEGEVLLKIGKADSQSEDTGGGAKMTVKRWIYLPTARDPQTMTTVVLKNGKVDEVTRQVSR